NTYFFKKLTKLSALIVVSANLSASDPYLAVSTIAENVNEVPDELTKYSLHYGITSIGNDLYVIDGTKHSICKLVENTDGKWQVSTIAGVPHSKDDSYIRFKDDDFGTKAVFHYPWGITSMKGDLYVTDQANRLIRKIAYYSNRKTWQVSTIAGTGTGGFKDGIRMEAQFSGPCDITTMDSALYVIDQDNNCIRKLVENTDGEWQVSTIPSNRDVGRANGTIMAAHFSKLCGMTNMGGDLYLVDKSRIRRIAFPNHTSIFAKEVSISGNENTLITGKLPTTDIGTLTTVKDAPKYGTVVVDNTGGYTYTPNDPNSSGKDSFSLQVKNDQQITSIVPVAVTVTPISGLNAIYKSITQPVWGFWHYWNSVKSMVVGG
ncbi:MAG: Ig-like domain-containing protein, partial [Alphaproteobacteria bacterium]